MGDAPGLQGNRGLKIPIPVPILPNLQNPRYPSRFVPCIPVESVLTNSLL